MEAGHVVTIFALILTFTSFICVCFVHYPEMFTFSAKSGKAQYHLKMGLWRFCYTESTAKYKKTGCIFASHWIWPGAVPNSLEFQSVQKLRNFTYGAGVMFIFALVFGFILFVLLLFQAACMGYTIFCCMLGNMIFGSFWVIFSALGCILSSVNFIPIINSSDAKLNPDLHWAVYSFLYFAGKLFPTLKPADLKNGERKAGWVLYTTWISFILSLIVLILLIAALILGMKENERALRKVRKLIRKNRKAERKKQRKKSKPHVNQNRSGKNDKRKR